MEKENIEKTTFNVFVNQQRQVYKNIVSVKCPVLGGKVYFTSDGFAHLIYESNRVPRKLSEQYLKLISFIKYVPKILLTGNKIEEIRCISRKIKGKLTKTLYYEVTGFYKNKKLGVIVERRGEGRLKFKSVIPYYNRRKTKSPSN